MTRFGLALHESGATTILDWIRRAEAAAVPAVWLTSGSSEQMTLLAIAATQTEHIRLGTAIVPTYTRHPIVLAQQAALIGTLAPGRFTLGIGPSHRPLMHDQLGFDFVRPLAQTREYLEVLRQASQQGSIDFDGDFFHVHVPAIAKFDAPIMISALREASFRAAGAHADGAIPWICPAPYLAKRARPAMEDAARKAGRPTPKLMAHTFLCVNDDDAAVKADAQQRLAMYPRLPFYAEMLRDAGDEEAASGVVSDRMIASVVIHGSESACVDKLQAFAAESTADEVIASVMVVGSDRTHGLEAAIRVMRNLLA